MQFKKEILIILFSLNSFLIIAQTKFLSKKDTEYLFASVFNTINKNDSNFGKSTLPNRFIVNSGLLNYIPEFLAENTLSPYLKKYIEDNNWLFISTTNASDFLSQNKSIKMKDLKERLDPSINYYSKNSEYTYALSPPLYLNNKAFIIFQKSSSNEILDLRVFFFEMKGDNWSLVKEIIPYLL